MLMVMATRDMLIWSEDDMIRLSRQVKGEGDTADGLSFVGGEEQRKWMVKARPSILQLGFREAGVSMVVVFVVFLPLERGKPAGGGLWLEMSCELLCDEVR